MTESIPAPFLVWTDLRWEKINLNFPKQKGDTSDKKKPSNKHQGFGWSSRLFGTSLHSQPEKSCNIFLARVFFFFGLPACTCTPSLSQRALLVGESRLAKLPHKNTAAHIFATGYINSRWKHCCAAKIFLPAGRQFTEGLTLQGSARILFFLRCFVFSGAVWGKGWKKEHWLGAFSRHNVPKSLKSVFRVRLQKTLSNPHLDIGSQHNCFGKSFQCGFTGATGYSSCSFMQELIFGHDQKQATREALHKHSPVSQKCPVPTLTWPKCSV